MNFKKYVLAGSVFGSIVTYALFNTRDLGICNIYCGSRIDDYQGAFLLFPLVLIFSGLTYKLSQEVFLSWWKFAKYGIPVIFILSLAIGLELHHSPSGQWQDMFDAPALVLLYLIFTVGSIIQIIRGYRQA